MANTGEEAFPAADAEEELNPGQQNKNLHVDPISSDVAASLEIEKDRQEQKESSKKVKENEKKDAMETLKTTIIVSGIIVAVAGAIYAITKKLREK